MSTLKHKNIFGTIDFDEESKMMFGQLIDVNGVIMYEGENAKEFHENFISAVEDYILLCEEKKIPIMRTFKGVFNVRTTPEIHQALNTLSIETGEKINSLVNKSLKSFLKFNTKSGNKKVLH
jgi:predicted HicB family RNase H-like nuclease